MAIEPIANRMSGAANTNQPVKTANATGVTTIKSKSTDDRIEITANSDQIKKALDSAVNLPEINDERVASIKQALAEGSYSIDPERIAQKISQFGV